MKTSFLVATTLLFSTVFGISSANAAFVPPVLSQTVYGYDGVGAVPLFYYKWDTNGNLVKTNNPTDSVITVNYKTLYTDNTTGGIRFETNNKYHWDTSSGQLKLVLGENTLPVNMDILESNRQETGIITNQLGNNINKYFIGLSNSGAGNRRGGAINQNNTVWTIGNVEGSFIANNVVSNTGIASGGAIYNDPA